MTNLPSIQTLLLTFLLRFSTTKSFSANTPTPNTAAKWAPKIESLSERKNFFRDQKSQDHETIGSIGFHHIEFYCGDAKSTAYRFSLALGMPITCTTGQSTGNDQCVSYGLESENVRFLFTAAYSEAVSSGGTAGETVAGDMSEFDAPDPFPSFSVDGAHAFFRKHGLGAKAVGIEVEDASKAFQSAVDNGARPVLEPVRLKECTGFRKVRPLGEDNKELGCQVAEVELYGDVVLRFISNPPRKASPNVEDSTKKPSPVPFLPHMAPHTSKRTSTYGLQRIDHAVGNVDDLLEYTTRISKYTGFHEFAEFTSADVGTVSSGLNSVVLASATEAVLLPINEPVTGRRKSQIQTFLEQNEGPGLQHLALKTDDIFHTITQIKRAEEEMGGFELMKRPSNEYYLELPERLQDKLTPEQYTKIEELGLLADADEEGVLLQIFTKPIGDRPTFFIEIIQRIGCLYTPDNIDDNESVAQASSAQKDQLERPGCGGFGQGNFKELFKAIEDHEKTLKV